MRIVYFGAGNKVSAAILLGLARRHEIVSVVEGSCAAKRPVRLGSGPSALRLAALRLGVRHHLVDPRGREALADRLARLQADLICSVYFPMRITPELAAIPAAGAINLHPSALPAYRGPDPLFWQILDAVDPGGLTVHRIEPEFDAGAILNACPLPLEAGVTMATIRTRIAERGVPLLAETIDAIEAGTVRPRPQPGGTHRPAPSVDGAQALALLRPFERPLAEAWRLLRALEPRLGLVPFRLLEPGFVREIDGFEERVHGLGPGRIGRRDGRTFLAHPQGCLFLARRLAPGRWWGGAKAAVRAQLHGAIR